MKEYSISEIQELMEDGKLTARELVEEYLNRIKKIDKNGPKLNSIIELNRDVQEIADSLDEERKKGKIRGPLHGIPIILKDHSSKFQETISKKNGENRTLLEKFRV